MQIEDLLPLYAAHPGVAALAKVLQDGQPALTHCEGLHASSAPVAFAALAHRGAVQRPFLFVLNDEEEAGYFYHDLHQMLGDERVCFYPSTYRRAVKYAQHDAANEILRTDVLNRLSEYRKADALAGLLYIVTFPAALAERVAPPQSVVERSVSLKVGESHDLTEISNNLLALGFKRKDYVYETGE